MTKTQSALRNPRRNRMHAVLSEAERSARKTALLAEVRNKDILVVHEQRSEERDVSQSAARSVVRALNSLGLRHRLASAGEVRRILCWDPPDIMFNLAYGQFGEGGTLTGLATFLGIPCTYSSAETCPVILDKWRTKLVLQGAGLPVTWSVMVRQGNETEVERALASRDEWPLIGKPLTQGSSVGLTLIEGPQELGDKVRQLINTFGPCLIEPFLPGAEFTIGVLKTSEAGPLCFPPVEVRSPERSCADFESKYKKGALALVCPAPLGEEDTSAILDLALDAYDALGCFPVMRLDVRCDATGRPFVLEANHFPGMTPTSWLPLSASQIGWDYDLVLLEILGAALVPARRSERRKSHAARSVQAAQSEGEARPGDDAGVVLVTADLDPRSGNEDPCSYLGQIFPESSRRTVSELAFAERDLRPQPLVLEVLTGAADRCDWRGTMAAVSSRRVAPSLLSTALSIDRWFQRSVALSLGIQVPVAHAIGRPLPPTVSWPCVRRFRKVGGEQPACLVNGADGTSKGNHDAPPWEVWLEEYVGGDEIHVGVLTHADGRCSVLPALRISGPDRPWLFDEETAGLGSFEPDANEYLLKSICDNSLVLHEAMDRPPMACVQWRLSAAGPYLIQYLHNPVLAPMGALVRMLEQARRDVQSTVLSLRTV